MSFAAYVNETISSDGWSGFLSQAQAHLPANSRMALLALLNIPLLAIVFNVVRQLVMPRNPSDPPVVFHWLPIIGSAIGYGNDPLNFFFACREKYGDVFTFILFGRRVTVALGPKAIICHLTTPVFGKDVVYDVPNEKFMEQKRFVKVGLSTENFRAYVGMIEEEVEDFLNTDGQFRTYQRDDINEWGSFDVSKALAEITILTASRTLQGTEVRAGLDKTVSQLYNDLDGGFTPLNFLFPNLPLESYRRRDRAHLQMSKFYVDIVKKRRQGGNDHDHDMIAALMQQTYHCPIMIALLMAGQHTSSSTGSWTLLHIAHRPDIACEQVKHFSTPDGKLRSMTYEELRALPLLDAVIRETLRVHPPIHSIMRKVREDVVIPPTLSAPSKDTTYVVPKGHFVLACPAVSQADPRVWKGALDWEPLRWSDPEGVAAQAFKVYADENGEKVDYGFGAVSKGTESPYQPFGAGKHRCIGEQFAYLQLGTIISTFVRRFEMRIEQIPQHNYHTMITMPKTPRTIHCRRRTFAD
ncbi:cytochrome P450 [Infundibulicybe gibba]|nr:cytochrome P450 [Infundibulicybe gibba]